MAWCHHPPSISDPTYAIDSKFKLNNYNCSDIFEELRVNHEYLDLYLKDLKDRDLIVLGCTHYPIIKKQIQNYLGNKTKLLDMSECLPPMSNEGNKSIKLYFSYLDDIVIRNVKNILT